MKDSSQSLVDVAKHLQVSASVLARLISYEDLTASKTTLKSGRTYIKFGPGDLELAYKVVSQLTWLAVVTPDSWKRLTDEGLSFTLLSTRYTHIARMLRRGHRLAFYVTGYSAFCGIAEVIGQAQYHRTVWPQGVFPFRVPLNALNVRTPDTGAKAKPLLPALRFVENKRSWEQYFRTTIRLIPEADYVRIESAVLGTSHP